MDTLDTPNSSLQLDSFTVDHLRTAGSWAKFLGIVGFVFTGLIIISGLVLDAAVVNGGMGIPGMQASGNFVGILLMCALVFVPSLWMFQFSIQTKRALEYSDQAMLRTCMRSLKRIFMFYGILGIIFLALWLLSFLLGLSNSL